MLTEQPTWLDEAYSDSVRPNDLDGAARVERCRMIVFWLWKLFRFAAADRLLDWGGGDGLLVRKLRDDGIDAALHDPYSHNAYAIGFEGQPDEPYSHAHRIRGFGTFGRGAYRAGTNARLPDESVSLFQRVLSWPGREAGRTFSQAPAVTFFFGRPRLSRQAGKLFGYEVVVGGSLGIFYRPGLLGPLRRRLVRLIVSYHGMRTKQLLWLFYPKRSLRKQDRAFIAARFDTKAN